MDSLRFDRLAKRLAAPHSRREAVAGGGSLVGAAGLRRAATEDATPSAPPSEGGAEGPTFLFVQTATGGSLRPNPGAGTPAVDGASTPGGGASYLLELEGHHGETVYFSDRPDRIFGEAPTQRFLDVLGFTPENPPNAALVAQTDAGDDVVVLELLDPAYDERAGTVTYGAEILAEYRGEGLAHVAQQHVAQQQVDEALPETFGRASLFIDDCGDQTVICSRGGDALGAFGPMNFCWAWSRLCCAPCENSDIQYWRDKCNETFPACGSGCQTYTSQDCWAPG